MTHKKTLLVLAMVVTIISCSNSEQNNKADDDNAKAEQNAVTVDTNIIKIYVDENGLITANGNSISLKNLDSSFAKLKASRGTVYYSRANGLKDPTPEAIKVMELVIKHEVPIKLFTDKTFNTVVTGN